MEKVGKRRVALVTVANRGLGLEVCRQLAKHNLRVILTARHVEAAESAAVKLRNEGLDVVSAVVDVTDGGSVQACARDVTTGWATSTCL